MSDVIILTSSLFPTCYPSADLQGVAVVAAVSCVTAEKGATVLRRMAASKLVALDHQSKKKVREIRINSPELKDGPSWVKISAGRLSLHEQKRLTQLANKLRYLNHFLLERQIREPLPLYSYFLCLCCKLYAHYGFGARSCY